MSDLIPLTTTVGDWDPWIWSTDGHVFGGMLAGNKVLGAAPSNPAYQETVLAMASDNGYNASTWVKSSTVITSAGSCLYLLPISVIHTHFKTDAAFQTWLGNLKNSMVIIMVDPKDLYQFDYTDPVGTVPSLITSPKRAIENIIAYNSRVFLNQVYNSVIGVTGIHCVPQAFVDPPIIRLRNKVAVTERIIPRSYPNILLPYVKQWEASFPPAGVRFTTQSGPALLPFTPYTFPYYSLPMYACSLVTGFHGKGIVIGVSCLDVSAPTPAFLKYVADVGKTIGVTYDNKLSDTPIPTTEKKYALLTVGYVTPPEDVISYLNYAKRGNLVILHLRGNWWEPAESRLAQPGVETAGFIYAPENITLSENVKSTLSIPSTYVYNVLENPQSVNIDVVNIIYYTWTTLFNWMFNVSKNGRFSYLISCLKNYSKAAINNKNKYDGTMKIATDVQLVLYRIFLAMWELSPSEQIRAKVIDLVYPPEQEPRTMTYKPFGAYNVANTINGTGMWVLPAMSHTVTLNAPLPLPLTILCSLQFDQLPRRDMGTHIYRDVSHRREFVIPANTTSFTFNCFPAGVLCFRYPAVLNLNNTFSITVTNVCPHWFYTHRIEPTKKVEFYTKLNEMTQNKSKYPFCMIFETERFSFHCFTDALDELARQPGTLQQNCETYDATLQEIMKDYSWLAGYDSERFCHDFAQADWDISNGWMHSGYPIALYQQAKSELWTLCRQEYTWGLYHEIGHNHQTTKWDILPQVTELSNNIYALYFSLKGNERTRVLFTTEKWQVTDIALTFVEARNLPSTATMADFKNGQWYRHLWVALCLEFGWDVFRKYQIPYATNTAPVVGGTYDEKTDRMVRGLSDILSLDVSDLFTMFKLNSTAETKTYCTKYPKWVIPDYYFNKDDPMWGKVKFNKTGRNFAP